MYSIWVHLPFHSSSGNVNLSLWPCVWKDLSSPPPVPWPASLSTPMQLPYAFS